MNPDPNLEEIYYSDTIQCYIFFNKKIVYNNDGEYGSIYIDNIQNADHSVYESFVPIAKLLVNADIDSDLKSKCAKFLNN